MLWLQKQAAAEDQKLCVFLIENALHKFPYGLGEILVIVDLRGFRTENADIMFFKFLVTPSPHFIYVFSLILLQPLRFHLVELNYGRNCDCQLYHFLT